MTLTDESRRALRARSHAVPCRISIGKGGLTAGVTAEIRRALDRSDLVKVRIRGKSRDEIKELVAQACIAAECECVAVTGFVALLFRAVREGDADSGSTTGA